MDNAGFQNTATEVSGAVGDRAVFELISVPYQAKERQQRLIKSVAGSVTCIDGNTTKVRIFKMSDNDDKVFRVLNAPRQPAQRLIYMNG